MKSIRNIITLIILFSSVTAFGQTLNWRTIENQKHIANINASYDYGATAGLSYGYKVKIKIPVVFGAEVSIPFGNKILDDFKTKVGVQAEVYHAGNFSAIIKANGVFRQSTTAFVRMDNFGSEFLLTAGHFKSSWHIAADFGFDKAITTHIKNSSLMREYYPAVQDGWYIPTGGNFMYGIQGGVALNNYDVYLKIGKTLTQDFKTTPLIPYYLHLGINARF
jgi:hypothetical protein